MKTLCCNYVFEENCPVMWNPYNGVVQCHNCGVIWEPATLKVPIAQVPDDLVQQENKP